MRMVRKADNQKAQEIVLLQGMHNQFPDCD
jgi:hypothetical protein